jgi:hypothetical protein
MPQYDLACEINRLQRAACELGAAGNLDKVRAILFGEQLRESKRRLSSLEACLVKGYAVLNEDSRRQFEFSNADVRASR